MLVNLRKKYPFIAYLMPFLFYLGTILVSYLNYRLQDALGLVNTWLGLFLGCLIYTFIIGMIIAYMVQIGEKDSFFRLPLDPLSILLFLFLFIGIRHLISYIMLNFPLPLPNNQATIYQSHYQLGLLPKDLVFAKRLFVFLPLFWEELIFRGVVMKTYFKNSPYFLDILVSAILFALFHHPTQWTDFIPYALPAIPMALLYRRTNSIYYSFLFHLVYNYL